MSLLDKLLEDAKFFDDQWKTFWEEAVRVLNDVYLATVREQRKSLHLMLFFARMQ